jgi:hypothetical protein
MSRNNFHAILGGKKNKINTVYKLVFTPFVLELFFCPEVDGSFSFVNFFIQVQKNVKFISKQNVFFLLCICYFFPHIRLYTPKSQGVFPIQNRL